MATMSSGKGERKASEAAHSRALTAQRSRADWIAIAPLAGGRGSEAALARTRGQVRQTPGEEAYALAHAAGQALSPDQAIAAVALRQDVSGA